MSSAEDISMQPSFPAEQAEAWAARAFGLYGTATPLESERDQNFLITTPTGRFVLKISNPTTGREVLELENQAIRLAFAIPDFDSPQIVKSVDNHSLVEVAEGPHTWYLRCLTFVDGTPLAEYQPHSTELMYEVGRCLGLLDIELATLNQNPASRRSLRWDLTAARPFVENAIQEMPDRDRSDLLLKMLARVEAIAPRWEQLPKSVIHNDANDRNLLVVANLIDDRIGLGLIDFGDMLFSATVHELAVACAYCAMEKREPLRAIEAVVAGYHHVRELSETEISCLFPLIGWRLAQSVSIGWQQIRLRPDNAYLSISQAPAWELMRQLAEYDPTQVSGRLRDACRLAGTRAQSATSWTADQISQMRRQYLGPSLSLSYDQPLKIVRGSGPYLYDDEGVTYLDCVNNVCHVGHCHPQVVQAVSQQMAVLNTNTRYLHPNIVQYARQLLATLPEPLEVCFFVNSGSEANDLALRLARTATGGRNVVVVDNAYHGHTSALIDISPYKFKGPGGTGGCPPGTFVTSMPDGYRGKYRREHADWAAAYARDAIETVRQAAESPGGLAAFFAESLLGCGGQWPLPDGYLETVYAAVREFGGVCVADEVQVGFGRVGKCFWGFQLGGVVPDIVTMGKPIGNGHPLAALVTTRSIAQAFANGMEYFNTFGGNPVSCAAGMAVLQVIHSEGLQEHANQVGTWLDSELAAIRDEFSIVGDVRGTGLFWGIEIVDPADPYQPDAATAKAIVESMKARRILLSTDGPDHNVIKFKPPMVFELAHAERVCATLRDVLGKL